MSTEKEYTLKLTGEDWARICVALMEKPGNGDLHRKIAARLPYLSDKVLDSFNQ